MKGLPEFIHFLVSDSEISMILIDEVKSCRLLQDLKSAGIKIKYKPLMRANKQKILENKTFGYKNILIGDSLDYVLKSYIRNESEVLKAALEFSVYEPQGTKEELELIIQGVNNLEKKDADPRALYSDSIADYLQMNSSPSVFVDSLIEDVKLGRFNYLNSAQVPRDASIFKLKGPEMYINTNNLIRYWVDIFGYKCGFEPVEVKRYCWSISEKISLFCYNCRDAKFRKLKA
jgi:hypothetical protein